MGVYISVPALLKKKSFIASSQGLGCVRPLMLVDNGGNYARHRAPDPRAGASRSGGGKRWGGRSQRGVRAGGGGLYGQGVGCVFENVKRIVGA